MKGLCCEAQRRGDLGKPLVILIHHRDGSTTERCGTCEVVPSCANPQKRVFRFKFIPSADCNLPGKKKCMPTGAGVSEYEQQIPLAASGRETLFYDPARIWAAQRIASPAPYRLPNP